MIKEIVKDEEQLKIPCRKATQEDMQVVQDLLDTAEANKENCIGLAANQIGSDARIIVVFNGKEFIPLINPVITPERTAGKHMSEERCLSLEGSHIVERFNKVAVVYRDLHWNIKRLFCNGTYAVIVQHELDHLNGILI